MKINHIFYIILINIIFNAHSAEEIKRDHGIHSHGSKCSILSTPQEHKEAFKYALETAKKSILITGYGNIWEKFGEVSPYNKLFEDAKERGVRTYSRWKTSVCSEKKFPEYLKSLLTSQVEIDNHAKILLVDSSLLIIGSYNWFTELPSKFTSLNRSIIIEGIDLSDLKEKIWPRIIYHQHRKLSNPSKKIRKRIFAHRRTPENHEEYIINLNETTTLSLLNTIPAHRLKLVDCFKKAKDIIIVLSPFVSAESLASDTYQKDFTYNLLDNALDRKVHLVFVCKNGDNKDKYKFRNRIRPYFDKYQRNPYFHLIFKDDIHAKTVIVDSDIIAEGSFNWLESARFERFEHYKYEVTMVCHGTEAAKSIDDFYKTDLGKEIKKELDTIKKQPILVKRKSAGDTADHPSAFYGEPERKKQKLIPAQRYQSKEIIDGNAEDAGFFDRRIREINQELWIDHPLWTKFDEGYMYIVHKKYYAIIKDSANRGWLLTINKIPYRQKDSQIQYFSTIEEAKKIAYMDQCNKL